MRRFGCAIEKGLQERGDNWERKEGKERKEREVYSEEQDDMRRKKCKS